jgi:hypothetical protein
MIDSEEPAPEVNLKQVARLVYMNDPVERVVGQNGGSLAIDPSSVDLNLSVMIQHLERFRGGQR